MHTVALLKATGRLLMSQTDGNVETMQANVLSAGLSLDDVEIRDVTDAELAELLRPRPTLEEAVAAKCAEIGAGADAILLPLVAEYPDSERATWPTQEAEARALLADPDAPAPLVRAMATARGIEPGYLAGRILYHAERWKAASGPIIGQRQTFQNQLEAAKAEGIEAVQTITVEYSLPGA